MNQTHQEAYQAKLDRDEAYRKCLKIEIHDCKIAQEQIRDRIISKGGRV
jgi:hypothetical protein